MGMIKKLVLAVLALCFTLPSAWSQKPVALQTMALFQGKQPASFAVFRPGVNAKADMQQYVDSAFILTVREDQFRTLRTEAPALLRFTLPDPLHTTLDLYRVSVFGNGAKIRTSDGRTFTPDAHNLYYRGMIQGDPGSVAIVSVFEDRMQIVYADASGNTRIQRQQDGTYVAFRDKDIRIPKQMECYADLIEQPAASKPEQTSQDRMTGNCVEVYVECDYKSYQDNGSSVPATEEWVGELWNEVITLYENEDIPVAVSDVFVYTSSDPFAGLSSTSAVLSAFRAHIDTLTYNGRLAHLLSTRTLGGGIAYLDVLCSTTHQVAFSANLSTNIIPFPTYSWTVEVVTHEMGHNMGSSHTHACVWNGNNTQIDDCGNVYANNNGGTPEGAACFNANSPILPTSGTIMSYCHLIGGIGINFNNGFGPQPGNRIRAEYNGASCNTGTCAPPLCTSLSLPLPFAINVDINQDLFWNASAGAVGYKLTIGTTPTNASILNNVDVGNVTTYNPVNPLPFNTTIYVKIVPYNSMGDAVGCSNQSFTTEQNVAPSCTQLTFPVQGATGVAVDVVLQWAHSTGNQTGYKISIGTTLNGTDIVNQLNVGNVTTYDHPSSYPYGTTLYVKITPYWTGGDINGCSSVSFTTFVPMAGDFCSNAVNLPCGGSLQGTTVGALSDSGLPVCVAAIEAPGVWYKFTGDGTNAIISLCSAYGYDTQLNAYSGTCSNLTCVTGIDDFCYTGSAISFPTTSGTTYYILVQGWGGQQGTFTITRTCYTGPFYCLSSGRDPFAEWIQSVNFNSTAYTNGQSSYSDYLDEPIDVSRGGTYSLVLTPAFNQGTRTVRWRVWVDADHDGVFETGEKLMEQQSNAPISTNITIPLSAVTGQTRMRISMRYNTSSWPSSCGTYERGEVEDYMLNIKCNLVTTTSDSGNGSLRSVSGCVADGEPVLFASSLNNQTINVTNGPITCDGNWKWMANAGSNIEIKAGNISRILSVPAGTSMEIQNLELTGGTATSGSAIDNDGALILRDCMVHPATGTNWPPIHNSGTIQMFGACIIQY